MRIFMKILLIIIIVLFVSGSTFILGGLNSELLTVDYSVKGRSNTPDMKIAVISDLHSCKYGENQSELIDAVDAGKPDIVIMTGDIFDRARDDSFSNTFLSIISKKYPCYYVTGNHEYRLGPDVYETRMNFIDSLGIVRLSGEFVEFEKNGKSVNICGVEDPKSSQSVYFQERETYDILFEQLKSIKSNSNGDNFSILISHRPELFEDYVDYGFDLVLCGHAHGGQIVIPHIANGLLAPNQGFFPEYAGGEYRKNNTVMIVSRGLARGTVNVPRLYNRPELVFVTINGQ